MLNRTNLVLIGIIGAIILSAAIMRDDAIKKPIILEPTAKQLDENEKRQAAEIAKHAADEKMAEEKATSLMMKSGNEQLEKLLDTCRSSIMEYSRSSYKGPFNLYMVDIYSADIYQLMAGARAIETDEERIKKAKKYYSTFKEFDLNTEFAILYTVDSFSAPQKITHNYNCKFSEGYKKTEVSRMPDYN